MESNETRHLRLAASYREGDLTLAHPGCGRLTDGPHEVRPGSLNGLVGAASDLG